MKSLYIVVGSLFFTIYGFGQTAEVRKKISGNTTKEQSTQLANKIQTEQLKDENSIYSYKKSFGSRRGTNLEERDYFLRRIDELGNAIYYTLYDDIGREVSGVNTVQNYNNINSNLSGQNMIVGVLDGQVILDNHQEFISPNNASRVILRHQLPSLVGSSDAELKRFQKGRSHATHVGGIIAAEGKENRAKGIVPKAQLWSYTWKNDNISMASLANEGVVVSNHSYGLASMDENKEPILPPYYFGVYTKDASMFDYITHSYPYYQPVVAAGNDGEYWNKLNPNKNGNDLLLGTANSKNSIVVGAVQVLNPNQIQHAKFSSVGPTNDFRIKPDISAHGVGVYSANYINPNPITSPPNTEAYIILNGTSMAAPLVSGIVSLWQQWGIEQNKMPYRSATIRALITHTAKKTSGRDRPDHQLGYGIVSAENGVKLLENQVKADAFIYESTLIEGKKNTYVVDLNSSKDILRVTLAWTDPHKPFSSTFFEENLNERMLVNDLDIKIIGEKGEYYPWKLVSKNGQVLSEQGVNNVDNLEQIEVFNAPKGRYTIEISHKEGLQNKKQDYSLVISDGDFGGINMVSANIDEIIEDISIWPNPMSSFLNIDLPKESINSEIEVVIYTVNGVLVDKQYFNHTNSIQLPVQQLQVGAYIVVVSNGSWKKDYKVIKK
ncbi:MAG: S8 family serine peptidase [Flavobacteriaceae bacterium]|jgi:subtilisin family serine protease|nr:S8 family serine peptidase [Flavobacteriaceae bacterium]